jgi:nucleoside-diphosphate-sugar epimerase
MTVERILVTGGTGFTGGHLCKRLLKEGYRVRTIARTPEKAASLRQLGVEVIPGDIVDFETVLRATEGMDKVYHLAALYRQEGVARQAFWDVHVTGTENLLKAAARQQVQRFIHCSTVGVHGGIKQPPANEDGPYRPGDIYQESKLAGERVAAEWMGRGEMPITICRPAGIYGPGDLRFLKLFKSIYKRSFWMIGSGEVLYHFTYIDDLIEGMLLCGNKEESIGRVYILAGNEYVTLSTLVSLISEALRVSLPKRRIPFWPVYAASYLCELACKPFGIEPPLYRRRVDFFRKDRAFDTSRARRELGFRPQVDLKTGVYRTAEWYKEQGYLHA